LTPGWRRQEIQIARRARRFPEVRPRAEISGRSVIVADDGIATGSTLIAALRFVRDESPRELIAAAPVGSPDRIEEVRRFCDEVVCLLAPETFFGISSFYEDFSPVSEQRALEWLAETTAAGRAPVE
jgi:putative phosphoribosyl transferase